MKQDWPFSARAELESALTDLGCDLVDLPILQPADPFLDTAGEDLRRRIFMTSDDAGTLMCLRPEFTIPVCLRHFESAKDATRYAYVGAVFRQRRHGGSEFIQAGIEDIGDEDRSEADARSLAESLTLLRKINPDYSGPIRIGDQAVFEAILDDLDLDAVCRQSLISAFGDPQKMKATLARLVDPKPARSLPDDLQNAFASGAEALRKAISERMSKAGLSESDGRTALEIAERILDQQTVGDHRMSGSQARVIGDFLTIKLPCSQARGAMGMVPKQALENFQKRVEAFDSQGLDLTRIQFDAAFGRPLDYYTGFVFEALNDGEEVIIGGGRYDHLLEMLGDEKPVPAVGFSIWLDRARPSSNGDAQ